MKKRSLYEHAEPLTVDRDEIPLSAPEFQSEEEDFCISFYESIRRDKPDFIECLMFLGNVYTKRGRHQEGLEVDLELVRLRPLDPVVHYNLACSYSLLGSVEEAIESLIRAKQYGYQDYGHKEDDPDLANIRSDARYRQLVHAMKSERPRLSV